MPPTRRKGKMKEEAPTSISAGTQTTDAVQEAAPTKETTIVTTKSVESTPSTSPTFQVPGKTPPRKVNRLKCPSCNDYPDGFRSEHEVMHKAAKYILLAISQVSLEETADSMDKLRRHSNRVHRKVKKVWMTFDSSINKTFLANCKACQTGKKYNECYNAASHLRRMHFHPHKRGERKMSASEARRGGKVEDLSPSMEELKANWLREVEEVVGENDEQQSPEDSTSLPPQPATQTEGVAPPTPTTPSTRSMAIDSIVDKMDAS